MSDQGPIGARTQQRPTAGGLNRLFVLMGHFLFRARDALFPAIFLMLAFSFQPVLAGGESLDRGVDALGLAVAGLGQVLRAAVLGLTPIGRGGKKRRIHADTLMRDGIFAHCRNPLYDCNLLIVLGLIVIHNSPWFYAIGLPFFLVAYFSITLAEEDYLRRQFGREYEDYCRGVPRYWIRFRGLRDTLASMRFNWKRLTRKEYGSTFAWVSTAFLLLGWQAVANFGWEAARSEAMTLLVFWLPLLAAYVTARVLKKTGRLGKESRSA